MSSEAYLSEPEPVGDGKIKECTGYEPLCDRHLSALVYLIDNSTLTTQAKTNIRETTANPTCKHVHSLSVSGYIPD